MAHYVRQPSSLSEGKIFEIDAGNKLCLGSDVKNLVNPSEVGTFQGTVSNVGEEYVFNGAITDYIGFSPFPSIDNLTELTMEVWFKRDDTATLFDDMAVYVGTGSSTRVGVEWLNNNLYGRVLGANCFIQSQPVVYDYQQIAITYIGGTELKLYKDTVEVASDLTGVPADTGTSAGNAFNIGIYASGGVKTLGQISKITIYNKSLTQEQLFNNYIAQKSRFQ